MVLGWLRSKLARHAFYFFKNNPLVLVKYNLATHQFKSLDEAIAFAKELGEFVTIQFDGKEVVGVFGATGVADGKCPDGVAYSWKKRRK